MVYNSNQRPVTGRNNNGRNRKRPNMPVIIASIVIFGLLVCGIVGLTGTAAGERDSVSLTATHYPDLEQVAGTDWPVTHYEGFSLAYDENRHTPVWVGWELLATEADGTESRSNRFWQDDDVYGCASSDDYKNSGYDRGHMCPAADQKWSKEAMRACFSMANMAPQVHALNSGAWKTLEEKERLWSRRDSAIVIVAGPVYTNADTQRIGETGVLVPGAFYKVILAPYLDKPRAIGFVYPNAHAPGNMQDYAISVDDVEQLTGLDFFATLPDSIESVVESHFSFSDWNRR